MSKRKLSVHDALQRILPTTTKGTLYTLPFIHDVTTTWDMSELDPASGNDAPSLNITVMTLILATNIETTIGVHAWSLVESTLKTIGFTNVKHHYFELTERINHPAMVFGRSKEPVNGKYVVAAVFRGSSSIVDFISDAKSQLDQIRDRDAYGGFHNAGVNATNELKAYLQSQGLTKENTTLMITGHSYGAVVASLVGIMSAEFAERDSIFCYSFATPNYIRLGLTGDGMKMFSFDSNEDLVPQVPVGPNMDKTGKDIIFNRVDIKTYHPERYERFLRLYKYFRENDFDHDSDFMPEAYSFKPAVRIPVNSIIVRNHMPYTYMALILSELPDEAAYAYISGGPKEANNAELPELEMYVGEAYKLPSAAGNIVPFSWKSSDETIVSVAKNNLLRGKGAGRATLTAASEDGKQVLLDVIVK